MATKQVKSSSAQFAKGGSTKMFPEGNADPAQPGVSTADNSPANNKFGIPPNVGKGKMFGQQQAEPMNPGSTADQLGAEKGDNKFTVKGGTTKMFGYTPSNTRKPS